MRTPTAYIVSFHANVCVQYYRGLLHKGASVAMRSHNLLKHLSEQLMSRLNVIMSIATAMLQLTMMLPVATLSTCVAYSTTMPAQHAQAQSSPATSTGTAILQLAMMLPVTATSKCVAYSTSVPAQHAQAQNSHVMSTGTAILQLAMVLLLTTQSKRVAYSTTVPAQHAQAQNSHAMSTGTASLQWCYLSPP